MPAHVYREKAVPEKPERPPVLHLDFGGEGPPLLLLHGLAGRANEWHSTAQRLTQQGHVPALDQRGHGRGEKGLADYSRDA
jgi:pimeloyl-ACP methyl ester carboxylesterase